MLKLRSVEHLCYFLNLPESRIIELSTNSQRYYRKKLRQIKGKVRTISIPNRSLKPVLRKLNDSLQSLPIHPCFHGGIARRSIKTHAGRHTSKQVVLSHDINDFFPSVGEAMVIKCFRQQLHCSQGVADLLAGLVCCDGCLPQGSPASSIVAALCLTPLARRLESFTKHRRLRLSIYVDDITVSGNEKDMKRAEPILLQIIEQEGFTHNVKKRSYQQSDEVQTVTGLVVNNGLRIRAEYLRDIDRSLMEAELDLLRGVRLTASRLRTVSGKIAYVSSIEPDKGLARRQRLRELVEV